MNDAIYNLCAFCRRLPMALDLFWRPDGFGGINGWRLSWQLARIAFPYAAQERKDLARIREIIHKVEK